MVFMIYMWCSDSLTLNIHCCEAFQYGRPSKEMSSSHSVDDPKPINQSQLDNLLPEYEYNGGNIESNERIWNRTSVRLLVTNVVSWEGVIDVRFECVFSCDERAALCSLISNLVCCWLIPVSSIEMLESMNLENILLRNSLLRTISIF